MTRLLAGILLGLAGSSHCVAMCGPLLLAINPTARSSRRHAFACMLRYHGGRILTYALLGVLVGYVGEGLILAGVGRGVAILAGALLLLAAAGTKVRPIARLSSWIAIRASCRAMTFARRHQALGYVALGLANGLIPCGLLYAALATAASSGTVVGSVVFMIGFGTGTVPLLALLTMSATAIPSAARRRLRVAVSAVMVVAGILLIVRGVLPIDRDPARHSRPSILSHH